jgi:hypothetical protein
MESRNSSDMQEGEEERERVRKKKRDREKERWSGERPTYASVTLRGNVSSFIHEALFTHTNIQKTYVAYT